MPAKVGWAYFNVFVCVHYTKFQTNMSIGYCTFFEIVRVCNNMSIYNGIYSKGASVPVNRHPSFHFRKLVFSFIHKSFHREREREREREFCLFFTEIVVLLLCVVDHCILRDRCLRDLKHHWIA